MAPRRRSRKPGLTRMDAAVDAMLPFGFSDNLVQRKVKELLKEYGGDEGWPFIEADAYKILIDAILDEQEGEAEPDKCSQGENICLDEPLQVERIGDCSVAAEAGPSSLVLPICSNVAGAAVQTIETEDREHVQPAEGDGERREANALDQGGSLMDEDNDNSTGYDNFESQMQLDNARLQSPPSASCSIPATDNLLTATRKPLYGWIGSDEEEDFIELTPALRKVSFKSAGRVVNGSRTGSDKQQLKRKSRWDVRPKDT